VTAVDAAHSKLRTLELRCKYETTRVKSAVGPFAVLGLLRDATDEDVKARRGELQLMLRPDQVQSDELTEATKCVNDAYSTLIDPEKRAAYEEENSLRERGRDAPGGGHDWQLGRAVQRRHEETLQGLLDPLFRLLPPKGVHTTINNGKKKLAAKVIDDPAFTLACDLQVTEAVIRFEELTSRVEQEKTVPFRIDEKFRAARRSSAPSPWATGC
jgi:curved DNA-binding protein CbpA